METLQLILESNIPWSVALVAIVWLLKPVLLKLVTSYADHLEQEERLAADHTQAEREQTRTLSELRDELKLNRVVSSQTLELINAVAGMPAKLDGAISEMRTAAQRRDQAMDRQTNILKAVQTDVANLPAAVWRDGQPRLDAVRTAVEQALSNLEQRISDQLPAGHEAIRELIRSELATFAARLQALERQAPPPSKAIESSQETSDHGKRES